MTKQHVEDIGPKGLNEFTDVISGYERLSSIATISGNTGETMHLGELDGKNIVLWSLLDDGNPSRGNRQMILDPDFNFMGSYTGDHRKSGKVSITYYLQNKMILN